MEEKNNLENLVKGLSIVKEEFFKNKDELKVSIRKDVVAVELKAIIEKTDNYLNLKAALENYIKDLYKI